MRGRNIKLMALPAKLKNESDEDYKLRLRAWQGFQWRQYGMKRLEGGETVADEDEQWVKDLKAEYAGVPATGGGPNFDTMKPNQLRSHAKRLHLQVEQLQADALAPAPASPEQSDKASASVVVNRVLSKYGSKFSTPDRRDLKEMFDLDDTPGPAEEPPQTKRIRLFH